jgi:hypothetical protein
MTLDFTVPGEVKVTMIPYVKEIVQQFAEFDDSDSTAATPAAEHLFKVNDETTPLTERQATIFHNFVARVSISFETSQADIATAVSATRVKGPDEDDWKKAYSYDSISARIELPLILRADSVSVPQMVG